MTIVLPHTWVKAACQPGRKIVSTSDTLETEDEERYFAMLMGDNIGKALTNKAEYLLMT